MFAYRWGARGERRRVTTTRSRCRDCAPAPATRRLARRSAVDAGSKSFRVGDVNFVREVFTVEVYATIAPEEPEWDAVVAPPWSTLPWHVLVLMEEAVGAAGRRSRRARRRAAASHGSISSARSESNAQAGGAGREFEREGYRPEALQRARERRGGAQALGALLAFHKAHGHFLVTNGPYRLKSWSADSVTLEAFRDLTYPLGVGSYDAYAVPRRGFVTEVDAGKDRVRLSGDIETVVKFARNYRIERAPIQSISRDVLRRSAPECRYIVTDDKGQVAFEGIAALDDGVTFQIDLNGKLDAGDYTVMALIMVNENAMNADIRRIPVQIAPGG